MDVKEKKKAAVLAALVVVLAGYLAWGFIKPGDAGRKPAPAAPAAVKKEKLTSPPLVKVDLALLKCPREGYTASRNIFDPVYRKPVLEKPVKTAGGPRPAGMASRSILPPPPPPKTQAQIDAENAREEIKKAKVIGFLKRKGRTDVFLSFSNGNYVVAKGDNITKDYFLTDIGKDSVSIKDNKTGIEVKVSAEFTEKKAKTASTIPTPGLPGAVPLPPGQGRPAPPGTRPVMPSQPAMPNQPGQRQLNGQGQQPRQVTVTQPGQPDARPAVGPGDAPAPGVPPDPLRDDFQ